MNDDLERSVSKKKAKEIARENHWNLLEVNEFAGKGYIAVFDFSMLNITDIKSLTEYPDVRIYNRDEASNYDHAIIRVSL